MNTLRTKTLSGNTINDLFTNLTNQPGFSYIDDPISVEPPPPPLITLLPFAPSSGVEADKAYMIMSNRIKFGINKLTGYLLKNIQSKIDVANKFARDNFDNKDIYLVELNKVINELVEILREYDPSMTVSSLDGDAYGPLQQVSLSHPEINTTIAAPQAASSGDSFLQHLINNSPDQTIREPIYYNDQLYSRDLAPSATPSENSLIVEKKVNPTSLAVKIGVGVGILYLLL